LWAAAGWPCPEPGAGAVLLSREAGSRPLERARILQALHAPSGVAGAEDGSELSWQRFRASCGV
jgi:hypothetical protein